ncbi:TRAP transporter large permease [Alcaligenes sp. SDU_A2]|uniref:TRAP transporter large permease n=1 Tax=Alcaligenes sp. SDU_A2 TaxID=3136634 RepID=UPI00311FD22D
MNSASARLNALEKPFLFIGLLLMILIINYQTLFRYVMATLSHLATAPEQRAWLSTIIDPDRLLATLRSMIGWASWTEELSRYIFIWISYLAVSLTILTRSGIRVDVLHKAMNPAWSRRLWLSIDLLSLLLTGLLCFMGAEHIQMQLQFPQTTPALQISYAIPYLILPIGFGLMALRCVQDILNMRAELTPLDWAAGLLLPALLALPVLLSDELNPSLLLFGYFAVLVALGVPIAFSLGLATLATVVGAGTLPMDYLAQIAFVSIDSFPIMAIPFFIAAGVFMGAGGLSNRLLAVADKLVGSLPGGLALAAIMTCMFFSAISGSGPATVAAIGTITIPAMIARGYDKAFAACVVACAGAIGVIIPPSNPFVVYGVSGQVSIGKLFVAGIVPGILMGLALMLVAYLISRRQGWRGEPGDRSPAAIGRAIWEAKWALLVPVIILGGIYGGIMTPTESAAVAALYGLLVGLFVYKEITLTKLWNATIESAVTSSIIILLMAMATLFGNIMTIEQIPEFIAEQILSLTDNRILILLFINVLLLVIGIFMEALAAIVIVTPVLLPLALKMGVDPIHFGIIMVMNLAIGFVTPPVGVNLFVASGIGKIGIEKIARAALPFLAIMLLILMLVTYVPEVSLWLTR